MPSLVVELGVCTMKMKLNKRMGARLELLLFALMVVVFWAIAAQIELFERIVNYVKGHEEYELDEAIVILLGAGFAGYIYAWRRHHERGRSLKRLIAAKRDLQWISNHDSLTGLPNRRSLQRYVFRHRNDNWTARPLGVVNIDLDGFKLINDLLGHDAGDELLRGVAERLRAHPRVRRVFRMGGDEFLVFVDGADAVDVMTVGEALLQTLAEPFVLSGSRNHVGASVGVSCCPGDTENLESAIHFADLAMFTAKRRRTREVVRFEPAMIEASRERASLEQDLLAAINDGQIEPYYQPLIDLKSGELRGFEALARWTRPGHGAVSPALFVSVAEQVGAINDLTTLILEKACEDALTWPDDLIVSVNLSPLLLADRHLALKILAILERTGMSPRRLEVEITEEALVQSLNYAEEVLEQLRSVGICIAVDDFGTGYSNLSQLSHLSFDRIKIDQSLINGLKDDPKKQKIVKTILFLSESLEIHSTAEGIEQLEEFKLLVSLGCDMGQGYFIGRPLSAVQTQSLIRQYFEDRHLPAASA